MLMFKISDSLELSCSRTFCVSGGEMVTGGEMVISGKESPDWAVVSTLGQERRIVLPSE